MNTVETILHQLGPCVLLSIPAGEKGPRLKGWQTLTSDDMDGDYLASLNHGNNVGVLLGSASEGLCTVDCDDDAQLEAFLSLNPELRESMISKGARGGNVWVRVEGEYPPPAKLSLGAQPWGEWRATGNQTIVHGTHPSGRRYRNNGKRPLTVAFDAIRWPDDLSLPWKQNLEEILPQPEEIIVPESTDLGRAQRFIERFRDDLRYVHAFKQWLVFEDGRWNANSDGAVHRLAAELCKEFVSDALKIMGKDERESALRAAMAWGSVHVVDNMLEAACNDRRIIAQPDELDANPWIIGARNAICDLRTGEIREHSRDHLVTKFLGADLDAEATCPRWEQFVAEIFPNESVRRFVQKVAGYSLTGLTIEHLFEFLYGQGANGKSTFLDTLIAAFGDYAGKAGPKLIYLVDRQGTPDDELAELFGKRFVVASEAQEDTRLNEGTMKDITGGNKVRARRKYGHGFEFKPVAKLWLMGNHKPTIVGTDDGIWRRVHLISFERQFGPEVRDLQLPEKLKCELSGIINWLVRGCSLWQQEGLNPPEIVRAAVDEYRTEEDQFGSFVTDHIETATFGSVGRAELYAQYKQWAHEEWIKDPLTMKSFNKTIRARKLAADGKTNGERVWKGITLK